MNTTTVTMSAPAKQDQARKRIAEIRLDINKDDREIIEIMARRNRRVQEIGKIKFDANMPVHDVDRERGQFEQYCFMAWTLKAPPDQVVAAFKEIVRFSNIFQQRGRT